MSIVKTINDHVQYSIPMKVTADTISDFGIKRADIVPAKIGDKIVSAIMVPCTKEHYYAYMRPIWAEMQREERSRRCMVSNGRGGLKRCEGDCSKCEQLKTCSKISVENMKKETGKEVPDPTIDASSIALTALLFNDLMKKLQEQNPQLA